MASLLEIFHIEVGSLSGNPKDHAEMIKRKFFETEKEHNRGLL